MPINDRLIPELVQQLKYMPEVVESLVRYKLGDETVTDEQVNEVLKDFLNEEQDRVTAVNTVSADRLERQKECDANKKAKVKPFDVKEYNKKLIAEKAKVGGVAARIEFAKRPEVIAANADALQAMHRKKIAEAFGKADQRASMQFTQDFEALRAFDADLAEQVYEKVTATSPQSATTDRGYLGRAYDAVAGAANKAQTAMYEAMIYKIAKYEVRSGMVVAAFTPDSQWRKDIELVKADRKFQAEMEKVAKRVGAENAREVAEARNVILALNMRFGKEAAKEDKRWFITVVVNGIAAGIAENMRPKSEEVEQPSPTAGVIGKPKLTNRPDGLEKYDQSKMTRVGVVTDAKAEQVKLAGLGGEAAAKMAAKQKQDASQLETGRKAPVVHQRSSQQVDSLASNVAKKTPPPLPPRKPEEKKGRGKNPFDV